MKPYKNDKPEKPPCYYLYGTCTMQLRLLNTFLQQTLTKKNLKLVLCLFNHQVLRTILKLIVLIRKIKILCIYFDFFLYF